MTVFLFSHQLRLFLLDYKVNAVLELNDILNFEVLQKQFRQSKLYIMDGTWLQPYAVHIMYEMTESEDDI